MSKNKPAPVKRRLGRAAKLRRRAPLWVMAKTRGRIRTHTKRRSWRRQRIKP
ncbi:MAG TPA: 50S ribosomal protein L39e [Hadesarchaea archaeon]|nr:50S ribosomal protein L39e [Hadesarchaea archaeon]